MTGVHQNPVVYSRGEPAVPASDNLTINLDPPQYGRVVGFTRWDQGFDVYAIGLCEVVVLGTTVVGENVFHILSQTYIPPTCGDSYKLSTFLIPTWNNTRLHFHRVLSSQYDQSLCSAVEALIHILRTNFNVFNRKYISSQCIRLYLTNIIGSTTSFQIVQNVQKACPVIT